MVEGILRSARYGAAAAALKHGAFMSALSEPLIPNKQSNLADSDSLSTDEEEYIGEVTDTSEELDPGPTSRKDIAATIAVSILVAGGLAASAFSMIVVQSTIVLLMGGICIVNSPIVAFKEHQIAKSPGIRELINLMRADIDFLKTEIDFLNLMVDDLKTDADVLVELERDLNEIAKTQNITVAGLIGMVNENEAVLSTLKANLRQTFVTAMASIVIRSDTDGDMKIGLQDLPLLSLRLQIQLDPYGITLDTDKFEAMIREDNDISNVLKFCGEVLFEGDQEKNEEDGSVSGDHSEQTFNFEEHCKSLEKEATAGMSTSNKVSMVKANDKYRTSMKKILEGDLQNNEEDGCISSDNTEQSFNFEEFCKSLDEEEQPKMSFNEKLSMVVATDKYSKGSVEVARGKRMTLMPCHCVKVMRRKTILKEVKKRQTKLVTRRASLLTTTAQTP